MQQWCPVKFSKELAHSCLRNNTSRCIKCKTHVNFNEVFKAAVIFVSLFYWRTTVIITHVWQMMALKSWCWCVSKQFPINMSSNIIIHPRRVLCLAGEGKKKVCSAAECSSAYVHQLVRLLSDETDSKQLWAVRTRKRAQKDQKSERKYRVNTKSCHISWYF